MLSDTRIRGLRRREKLYRVADYGGLCIEVATSGTKLWRYRYRYNGKARMIGLGRYPDVTLTEARKRRDEARRHLAADTDPSIAKRRRKKAKLAAAENTFEAVGRDWMKRQRVSEKTAEKNRWLLETFAFPEIGALPITEITSRDLLLMLRKVEATGKLETARRIKMKCGQVFRQAIREGVAETDPTASLRGALQAPEAKHHAAITDPRAIGGLLRAIDEYSGYAVTRAALRLLALVFVRPGELRYAEWSEFDLDAAEWRIPEGRMKMKAPHLVPLSKQAVAILKDLHKLTGSGRYAFPSVRSAQRPISENTLNAALRRMGFTKDEVCSHGFRAMASSRLNEMGWTPDAIERQLAHAESNKVRAAYAHGAQYLAERRRMMQAWADHLDSLRAGADVVTLKAQQA